MRPFHNSEKLGDEELGRKGAHYNGCDFPRWTKAVVGQSLVGVVAGLVATAPVWKNFSEAWGGVLRCGPKIDYSKWEKLKAEKDNSRD